ncbi:choline ABC transporter ATP-binding protein [Veronia nyctiphanis]|uniref:Choline ABC transporter ATP-binding protein n=1 Tax=Veronia nyctiphanis TaxID=1278244 RepID=A0A4Q0YPH2_9GAMM|nr:choline ABC transporter ATP-binding protein [Veronia nyctiphanis]RXJ71874.1 choline ABC transporter ATP-binding protein [Veronia nyctiphanis]
MKAISIKNLDVVFGDKPEKALALLDQGKTRQQIIDETQQVVGVDNVSLDVAQGEICVLMGLSGSGKSSLLRAINGLNTVSRGELLIKDGDRSVDVASCSDNTLRDLRTHRTSMVFQKFALMPWLTVIDNVAFGLDIKGMSKKARRTKACEQLEMVGLAEWQNKYPHELSGGMQQRVGLARAFAMDTDILLMDEPFSALDPLIRAQLQDELLTLQKTLNKTIVFVSHDLDEALKIGNNIAIMESGKLIQHGKPEDIVLNPNSQYVKDFVAHTNPLNVLRGKSLMKPRASLTTSLDSWQVCEGVWLEHTKTGFEVAKPNAIATKTLSMEELDTQFADNSTLIVVPGDISMRDAIRLKKQSQYPLVLQEQGTLIGVLGDEQLYDALLGNLPEQPAIKTAKVTKEVA